MSELAEAVAARSQVQTRTQLGRSILRWVLFLALVAGSILMIGPFLWMVSTSLKADGDVFVYPPVWIPAPIEWSNYLKVLVLLPFGRYLINTTVVTVSVTFLEVLTSSLAAYSFARLNFPGRDRLFLIYLGTLMVPGQVTIIPNFLLISVFGWVNSYFALIIQPRSRHSALSCSDNSSCRFRRSWSKPPGSTAVATLGSTATSFFPSPARPSLP
jgi:ABC-type glycerol-3-phosphate transport system permease component